MRQALGPSSWAHRRLLHWGSLGKAAGLLCVALCAGFGARADTVPLEQADRVWLAASDRHLDELRGGFSLGDGLMVSFGISQVSYINDRLVASTSLNLGALNRLTAQQAAQLQGPLASAVQGAAPPPFAAQTQLVQNGPGNSFEPTAAGPLLATVIQNSLNDQLLRTQTIINLSSNGLGIMRGFNLQKTLDLALSNAMGGR